MDFDTLIGLVKQYSPSGQEAQASSWLVDRMEQLGYPRSYIDPVGNAIGVMGDGPRQIVLLGHIDTVSGELPVRVEEGILHGRGSVDAKGPLACFTDSAAAVGPVPGWQIVVIGAVEEERDSIGARFILDNFHPQYLIVGEPNRWDRVSLGYKGSAWLKLRTEQQQAHSAGSGQTASEAAVDAWLRVRSLADKFNTDKSKLFDQVLINLAGMQTGTDGMTQWAELSIGARLPVSMPPQNWYDLLNSTLIDVEISQVGFPVPAWQCEKNTPLVRCMLAGIRAQGGTPSFVYKTGTADLNIVAPAWNCPAVVYGPGDSSLDHTPHEHLALSEYEQSIQVLTRALTEITSRSA